MVVILSNIGGKARESLDIYMTYLLILTLAVNFNIHMTVGNCSCFPLACNDVHIQSAIGANYGI